GMFESVDETAEGMLVFDTDNNTFFFWDGSKWVEVSESASSDPLNYADPNDPNGDGNSSDAVAGEAGQVKYNTVTESLWYYDGNVWVELGESSTGSPLGDANPNDPNGDGNTSDAVPGEAGQVKYNTVTESLWYYDGNVWVELGESSTGDPLGDNDPNDPNGDGDTSDAVDGMPGNIKYNTTTKTLWYYDGSVWNPINTDKQLFGEILTTDNDAGAKQIKNLLDPTNNQDAATKKYVDDAVTAGTPDASTTVKGIVQLAGDLAGTAALPVIAADAVTSSKILDGTITVGDLGSDAVETIKIKDG
ncbi:hypothetical protein QUH73_20795, partial [Labilibaculum sp. K2S]|uniref:hypothetical protein n=1 Tax=Labilibaculum sp. K2S TaxID=3056386 RepID=UPI0025A3E556